jgi:hypothetical protein
MSEELLIHSMGEFAPVTLPVLEAVNAKRVCEIGAEHGGNSGVLVDWLVPRGGHLVSIDPAPSKAYFAWLREHPQCVTHVARPSLNGIATVDHADAWFIDGDHNWYTVYHELTLIHAAARRAGTPLLVFLHDVGWPCARRDMYYAPQNIPAEFRQPHSWELGVTLGSSEAINGGFRGAGAFAVALQEGGPRNGVLTAIEDFAAGRTEEFLWAYVPAVFGLGVLFDREHPQAGEIATILAPYHDNPLLARLERNRLANYLKVIEWQDRTVEEAATGVVRAPALA